MKQPLSRYRTARLFDGAAALLLLIFVMLIGFSTLELML